MNLEALASRRLIAEGKQETRRRDASAPRADSGKGPRVRENRTSNQLRLRMDQNFILTILNLFRFEVPIKELDHRLIGLLRVRAFEAVSRAFKREQLHFHA